MSRIDAVKKIVESYIEGTYTGNADIIQSLFHENAVMTGYLGDTILVGGPQPFLDDLRSQPSMKEQNHPYKAEITSLSVTGNIADAVIYETGFFGDGCLENHLHILQVGEGEWKIVSKLFTTISPEK